jgi:hypothetical protein
MDKMAVRGAFGGIVVYEHATTCGGIYTSEAKH